VSLSVAVVAVGACKPSQSRAASDEQRVASAAVSSDSCDAFLKLAKPQKRAGATDTTLPPPHAGSWTATKVVGARNFTLLIPAVATIEFHKNDQQYWITDLPQCRYFCALTIQLGDKRATLALDSFVAHLRSADSADHDPDMTGYATGPATRLTIANEPAVLVEANCGDCSAGTLFMARGASVASVEYNVDDREGYQPALVCRLVAIAKTFRWSS